MKFKTGDKVMLKAVPYDNFCFTDYKWAKKIKEQKEPWLITSLIKGTELAYLNGKYLISFKYLKHAVKPKAVKYTIDCLVWRAVGIVLQILTVMLKYVNLQALSHR